MRNKSDKPHVIVSDDDAHKYLIPFDECDNFWEWVAAMDKCEKSKFDFSKNGIDGLSRIYIYEWEEI